MEPQCPEVEIRVCQVGDHWEVVHRDGSSEPFPSLVPAVDHALKLFRQLRHRRKRVVVLPPASPWMWD